VNTNALIKGLNPPPNVNIPPIFFSNHNKIPPTARKAIDIKNPNI
jgi:hypothetical protein